MPESGLNLTVGELRSEVGIFAGFDAGVLYGSALWDSKQTLRIVRSVKAGIRDVLYTEPVEEQGIPGAFGWSFNTPKAALTLTNGTNFIALPDDFGGVDLNFIPASVSGEVEFPVAVVGVGEIDRARGAAPNDVGRPIMAAIDSIKERIPGQSTRFELQVYPTADQDYVLQVRYYFHDDAFDGDALYPPGGPAHAETYRAAVRAAYERDYDGIDQGPMWRKFMSRLRASMDYDRRNNALIWGRNIDRSDGYTQVPFGWPHIHDPNETMPMIVNGTSY
jgi:hypothetical protein